MDTSYCLATLLELAQQLRVDAIWLKREADAGRIPCLRAGKRQLFNIDAVREVLSARARERDARQSRQGTADGDSNAELHP